MTDATGNIVEQLAYDDSTGNARTRYGYTGRERDPDTSLMHYRSRWYDPQQGRFISEDPIGFSGGDLNLYGYVWQSPLGRRDPLGLDGWGNDFADWLDSKIEAGRRYLESDPQYANYSNGALPTPQSVNPLSGQTIGRTSPWWHIPLGP